MIIQHHWAFCGLLPSLHPISVISGIDTTSENASVLHTFSLQILLCVKPFDHDLRMFQKAFCVSMEAKTSDCLYEGVQMIDVTRLFMSLVN